MPNRAPRPLRRRPRGARSGGKLDVAGAMPRPSTRLHETGVQREQLLEIPLAHSTAHDTAPPMESWSGPGWEGRSGPFPRPGRVGVLGRSEVAGRLPGGCSSPVAPGHARRNMPGGMQEAPRCAVAGQRPALPFRRCFSGSAGPCPAEHARRNTRSAALRARRAWPGATRSGFRVAETETRPVGRVSADRSGTKAYAFFSASICLRICASTAAIAVMFRIRREVALVVRMCTGLLTPIRIGPIATPSVNTRTRL